MSLAQDDFSTLGFADGLDADCQQLGEFHGFSTEPEGFDNDALMKAESALAEYRPVNFISDEVYELIRNWELSYLRRQEVNQAVDSMEAEPIPNFSESVFEPMRTASESTLPPPKRFFRTFWRSLTLRIVREKKQSIARTAISRSDASDDISSISRLGSIPLN